MSVDFGPRKHLGDCQYLDCNASGDPVQLAHRPLGAPVTRAAAPGYLAMLCVNHAPLVVDADEHGRVRYRAGAHGAWLEITEPR